MLWVEIKPMARPTFLSGQAGPACWGMDLQSGQASIGPMDIGPCHAWAGPKSYAMG